MVCCLLDNIVEVQSVTSSDINQSVVYIIAQITTKVVINIPFASEYKEKAKFNAWF